MPKMKSKRGAAKRFEVTASGKIKHKHQNKRHILTKKSPKRKRHLRKTAIASPADTKNLRELILA